MYIYEIWPGGFNGGLIPPHIHRRGRRQAKRRRDAGADGDAAHRHGRRRPPPTGADAGALWTRSKGSQVVILVSQGFFNTCLYINV